MTTERDIRNQNAFEREKAMQEGMTKGRELTARNLKGLGIATETIVKATGLTVEEITAL